MKRIRKDICRIVSLALCVAFIAGMPVGIKAAELSSGEKVYHDTEQGRFVNNLDEYLMQLNAMMIMPFNSTITEYESYITPFELWEPSKKCSNIFGHKWGGWTAWKEVNRYHTNTGECTVRMERWHYCTRTYCGASQKETDLVFVVCVHK